MNQTVQVCGTQADWSQSCTQTDPTLSFPRSVLGMQGHPRASLHYASLQSFSYQSNCNSLVLQMHILLHRSLQLMAISDHGNILQSPQCRTVWSVLCHMACVAATLCPKQSPNVTNRWEDPGSRVCVQVTGHTARSQTLMATSNIFLEMPGISEAGTTCHAKLLHWSKLSVKFQAFTIYTLHGDARYFPSRSAVPEGGCSSQCLKWVCERPRQCPIHKVISLALIAAPHPLQK